MLVEEGGIENGKKLREESTERRRSSRKEGRWGTARERKCREEDGENVEKEGIRETNVG